MSGLSGTPCVTDAKRISSVPMFKLADSVCSVQLSFHRNSVSLFENPATIRNSANATEKQVCACTITTTYCYQKKEANRD